MLRHLKSVLKTSGPSNFLFNVEVIYAGQNVTPAAKPRKIYFSKSEFIVLYFSSRNSKSRYKRSFIAKCNNFEENCMSLCFLARRCLPFFDIMQMKTTLDISSTLRALKPTLVFWELDQDIQKQNCGHLIHTTLNIGYQRQFFDESGPWTLVLQVVISI